MNSAGVATEGGDGRGARLAIAVAAGAVLCLVAAGALMWWSHGDAVFGGMITAALAWCF